MPLNPQGTEKLKKQQQLVEDRESVNEFSEYSRVQQTPLSGGKRDGSCCVSDTVPEQENAPSAS